MNGATESMGTPETWSEYDPSSAEITRSVVSLLGNSQAHTNTPSRERVSEAIALVRARQAAASSNVTKVTDLAELKKKLRKRNKGTTASPRNSDALRSPLTPVDQSTPVEVPEELPRSPTSPKSGSFLQNVFASRSEIVATSSESNMPLPNSIPDDSEENQPSQSSTSSRSREEMVDPIEIFKRECQLATQSQNRVGTASEVAKAARPSLPSVPSDQSSSDGEDSDASEDVVDARTIQDVSKFLDKLNITAPTIDLTEFKDPIVGLTESTSEDFMSAVEEESVDSSEGSVNPETLAEIGAFIDAVSMNPSSLTPDSETVQSEPKVGAFIDTLDMKMPSLLADTLSPVMEADTPISVPVTVAQDAPTFADPSIDIPSTRHVYNVASQPTPREQQMYEMSESTDSDSVDAQTRVSRPSPIYEQLEAASLPHGANKDPPACATTTSAPSKADPPVPVDWNEAVIRMRENEPVAPSYSAESLESGIAMDQPLVEDEKKMDEEETMPMSVEVPTQEDGMERAIQDKRSFELEAEDAALDGENPFETSLKKTLSTVVESHSKEMDFSVESETSEVPDERPVQVSQTSDENAELPLSEDMKNEAVSPAAVAKEDSEVNNDTDLASTPNIGGHEKAKPAAFSSEESEQHKAQIADDGRELDRAIESVLVDDAGVPISRQLLSAASDDEAEGQDLVGRYDLLEAQKSSEDESEASDVVAALPGGLKNLPNSPSMKDEQDSIPWELRDIASEETMKAAGRTRVAALNPASRTKARKLTSLLSDDSSVPRNTVVQYADSCDVTEDDADEVENSENEASDVLVVDEGEGGVEILETTFLPEEEAANDHEYPVLNMLSASSSEGDEPLEDPSGRLERSIEIDEVQKRPDPDADEDFVSAFLRQGSMTEDAHSPKKAVAQRKNKVTHDRYSMLSASAEMPRKGNVAQEEGVGFLQQFDDLGVEESEDENSESLEHPGLSAQATSESYEAISYGPSVDLENMAAIARYFARLDHRCDDRDDATLKNARAFQKLVAPVMAGQNPSIIEAAQIRQAAKRAMVELELVDRFLEYAEDKKPVLPEILSSGGAKSGMANAEDIEDLNEDEAIGAFLTRFGALHSGGHFPDSRVEGMEKLMEKQSFEEEAVEVDATFGYVNRDLAPQLDDVIDDNDQEWWEGAQDSHRNSKRNTYDDDSDRWEDSSEGESVEDSEGGTSNHIVEVSMKPNLVPTQAQPKLSMAPRQEEDLKINAKYSTSFGSVDNEQEWMRRTAMASHGVGWKKHAKWLSPRTRSSFDKPAPIDGVAAAEGLGRFVFSKDIFLNVKPWKRLYKERTQFHPGYFDVDIHSLYDSTKIQKRPKEDAQDYTPWEHRDVKQNFLHERSLTFSRNWFGDMPNKRGNLKYKPPYCKPKSMEMPMEHVPESGADWTEEWYTQWKSPHDRRMMTLSRSEDTESTAGYIKHTAFSPGMRYRDDDADYSSEGGSRDPEDDDSLYSGSSEDDDSDASWEEPPECGEIVNVKQKIGERISRVHPDYTSSLRRSRWRKKYFPRGTFPY